MVYKPKKIAIYYIKQLHNSNFDKKLQMFIIKLLSTLTPFALLSPTPDLSIFVLAHISIYLIQLLTIKLILKTYSISAALVILAPYTLGIKIFYVVYIKPLGPISAVYI